MSASINDDFVELVFGDFKESELTQNMDILGRLVQRCEDNPEFARKVSKALILWAWELHRNFICKSPSFSKSPNQSATEYDQLGAYLDRMKVVLARHHPESIQVYRNDFGWAKGMVKFGLKDIA